MRNNDKTWAWPLNKICEHEFSSMYEYKASEVHETLSQPDKKWKETEREESRKTPFQSSTAIINNRFFHKYYLKKGKIRFIIFLYI